MAFKVSSERLIDITKLIDDAYDAINNQERLGGNKILYPDLKKRMAKMSDTLKTSYDLESFDEWKRPKKKVDVEKKT